MTMIQYLRCVVSEKNDLFHISYETPEQDGLQDEVARKVEARILYSGRIQGGDTGELGRKIDALEAVIAKANIEKKIDLDEVERISGL